MTLYPMTTRLKKAIERVQALPEEKQDWVADLLLDALSGEREATLPFWVRTTPEERVAAFDEWVDGHTRGVGIPHEALRRGNLYD